MDIVDVQLHLGPDSVEPTLEAMDSLGIRSVLIEEFWIDQPGSRGFRLLATWSAEQAGAGGWRL